MSAKVELQGLEELKAALRNLPAELRDEANTYVEAATNEAEAALLRSYPEGGTGNLRKGVKKTIEKSAFGVVGTVKSTSRHAHLWEYGTVDRNTKQGWYRGQEHSARERGMEGLSAIAPRVRRKLNEQLWQLVKRAGFDLSGT